MEHLGLKVRMAIVGVILFGFYMLVAGVALSILGTGALPFVLIGILALPVFQYKLGKWFAVRSVRAEDMPERGHYTQVHHMTEALSQDMGIEKPRLMVASMGVPNAFATGRRGDSIVVVSSELLHLLSEDELQGVIAHELAHVKNRDVITMVVGQSIATMVGYAAYFVVATAGERNIGSVVLGWIASILANALVMIFVLAISRYREYAADADARQYLGSGDALARALEKISRGAEGKQSRVDDSVSALCIVDTDGSLLRRLFATHPPVEKRIERLRR